MADTMSKRVGRADVMFKDRPRTRQTEEEEIFMEQSLSEQEAGAFEDWDP